MNKGELQTIYKNDFNSFFNVMKKSFPEIERRTFEGQKSLFDDDKYKVLGYK
ncbi:MAG TPA: GNAT family N-acetyltransferase, partial [Clostridium sp.]|nr:GNAT family N-acetyltransferase [Clostridium sp.]